MTVCLPFFWQSSPSIDQYLLMGSIGLVVILVHFIFIKAYQNAEASILAPFHYFEIISNMLISVLFFKDIPNIIVCFGILCIVSSGVLITIKQKI
jgi:drug/metabolite transporter (DMT)-like permease